MQHGKTHCYLCGKNGSEDTLEEHHLWGGANRRISEKYGLKIYLCGHQCHKFGKNSAHQNGEVSRKLKAKAQRIAMEHYGWSVEDFRKIFGKSYI